MSSAYDRVAGLAAAALDPLLNLRAELQSVKRLDLRQPTWTETFLDASKSALSAEDPVSLLEVILGEILQAANIDIAGVSADTLPQFAVLLLSLQLSSTTTTPLIATLVVDILPALLEGRSTGLAGSFQAPTTLYATSILARMIKQSLLTVSDIYPAGDGSSFADELVEHLTEEMRYQRSRPVEDDHAPRSKKARKSGGDGKGMSSVQREMLEGLCGMLGNDQELRHRWPHFDEALTSAA